MKQIWQSITLAAPLMLAAALLTSSQVGALAADNATRTYECDSTVGWMVMNAKGQPEYAAKLSASDGVIAYEYDRADPRILVHHNVTLRGFDTIDIRVRSKVAATLAISLEDSDKASFYAIRSVAGGEWQTWSLSAQDFQLGDDSPVKKAALDPKIAGSAYLLVDIAMLTGGSGANTIEVDSVTVTTKAPAGD